MRLKVAALTALCACLALFAIKSPGADASLKAQIEAERPAVKPSDMLLSPEEDPSQKWPAQQPFDLSGPMPKDDEVTKSIAEGLEIILSRQDQDGGWADEEIAFSPDKGGLAGMARQAADAPSMTALCGLALRPHLGYDSARIGPALDKAVNFVMRQIFRGKLRLDQFYACWRYSLCLQFLANEYKVCNDAAKKEQMQACARRAINALLKLQMSNGEAKLLDRINARVVSEELSTYQLHGYLGIMLAPPTDKDFLGGAPVIDMYKDGPAHKGGVQLGDRIVEVEGLRVENAVDYYNAEATFLLGQRVTLKVKRQNGDIETATCDIAPSWAAYLGMEVGEMKDGKAHILQLFPLSPAAMGGCAVGDIITGLNGVEITTPQSYYDQLYKLQFGQVIDITVQRGDQVLSGQVQAVIAPEADFAIWLSKEDNSDEPGVRVGDSIFGKNAGDIFETPGPGGSALGMKPGDRLTHIANIPMMNADHVNAFAASIPAGIQVYVKYTSNGVAKDGIFVPRAKYSPGSLGVILDVNGPVDPPKIKTVLKGGAAASAGLQAGDVVVSLAGVAVPTHIFYTRIMAKFLAGQTIDIVINRGGKNHMGKVTLGKADRAFTDVEEGGWSYYPDLPIAGGDNMSFSTAMTLLALYDAAAVMGIKAPPQAIKAAEASVDNMRCLDLNNRSIETYAYRRSSVMGNKIPGLNRYVEDLRGCLGRNAVCELAMVRGGKRTKKDLEKTLQVWIQHRGELDKVRDFPGTHYLKLYQNAAYYWLYGHMYSILAAKDVGGQTYDKVNEVVVKALMMKKEKGGGWVHHVSFGKLCGTAMALMAFGETKGAWRK